jgi:hypothetical protein
MEDKKKLKYTKKEKDLNELHGVTFHKTATVIFTTLRTLNITSLVLDTTSMTH